MVLEAGVIPSFLAIFYILPKIYCTSVSVRFLLYKYIGAFVNNFGFENIRLAQFMSMKT